MDNHTNLATQTVKIRKTLGWSQLKLSQVSGITQATISRIESGKTSNPHISHVIKIADAFGTSIDNLIGRKP